jgi:hypothetical protein
LPGFFGIFGFFGRSEKEWSFRYKKVVVIDIKVLLTSTLFGIFLILIPLFLRASENSEKPENYLSVGLPGLILGETNPNRGLDYASWRISPHRGLANTDRSRARSGLDRGSFRPRALLIHICPDNALGRILRRKTQLGARRHRAETASSHNAQLSATVSCSAGIIISSNSQLSDQPRTVWGIPGG